MSTRGNWKIGVAMFVFCCVIAITLSAQADTIVGDEDNYIIEIDTDNGSVGRFIVRDYDGSNGTMQIIAADAQNMFLSSDSISVLGSLNLAGSTSSAGINNNDQGITNAGSISGVTTLTASSTITGNNFVSNGSLSVADGATINNGATIYSGVSTGNSLSVDSDGVDIIAGNNSLYIDDATDTIMLTADNDASSSNDRGGLIITPTSISLGTRNDSGEDRALWINETETVLSGGTGTTSMTLNDDGATFADASTGAPVTVTGIANGSSDFDAVNYKQLKSLRERAFSGIASVAALAAIPNPKPGKNYSIGTGFGNYAGESALALGGKAYLGNNISVGAGFGYTGDDFTTNVGLGYSW